MENDDVKNKRGIITACILYHTHANTYHKDEHWMRVTIRQMASESFNNSNHLQRIFPGRDFEWMKENNLWFMHENKKNQ